MSNPHLQRLQNWLLWQSSEGRCLRLSTIVGPGGLDNEAFSRAMGNVVDEGLYAFVWVGPEALPDDQSLLLKGNKIEDSQALHAITWSLTDFPEECRLEIGFRFPLYVGKTTTIRKRIGQHLHFSKDVWSDTAFVHRIGKQQEANFKDGYLHKHSTTCQFRSGMQHLFPDMNRKGFIEKLMNIELCFLPLTDVKDRFYLEDLAIGYFRPWFNVDSER